MLTKNKHMNKTYFNLPVYSSKPCSGKYIIFQDFVIVSCGFLFIYLLIIVITTWRWFIKINRNIKIWFIHMFIFCHIFMNNFTLLCCYTVLLCYTNKIIGNKGWFLFYLHLLTFSWYRRLLKVTVWIFSIVRTSYSNIS